MRLTQSKKRWLAALIIAALSCKSDSLEPGNGAVASVVISPPTATVAVGASVPLTAEVLDASGNVLEEHRVVWATSDAAIATVSGEGVVTGVKIGAVQIAASAQGKSAVAEVTVNPTPVASVRLSPTSRDLLVGQTVQLTAEPLDGQGVVLPARPVTFTTSNATVATVSSTGLVTALAAGGTIITAASEGRTAVATITVSAVPVATVVVTPSANPVVVGQTTQLKAELLDGSGKPLVGRPVLWSTSAANIATVSSTGLVTAVAPGEATISATSEGKSGSASVAVSPKPVSAVIVSPGQASVTVGSTTQLTAQVTDDQGNVLGGRPITFTSGLPSIATVNATGVVTGVATGTTTITATSEGKTGTATVTVTPIPVARVGVVPDAPNVTLGQTLQLGVVVEGPNGQALVGRGTTWSSGAPLIASVSGSGLVAGLSPGVAVIFASVEGVVGSATVTVRQVSVAAVVITPPTSNIIVGGAVQLAASVRDATGAELPGRLVGWSSSDEAIAVVSSTGRVSGLKLGTATITASSEGKSGTATVTVGPAPVASVTVTPPTASVTVGQTATFEAQTLDAAGGALTGRTITWSSSSTAVATVAQTGVVTGVAAGTATITATSEGKSGTATVTVSAVPVATVTVAPATLPLQVGATGALTATTRDAANNVLTGRPITWSSGNTAIATVAPNGTVTAVAPGSATITAASEGKTGTATVTVTAVPPAPVASVSVAPTSANLTIGGTQQITATPRDAQGNALAGRQVTWQTGNANVATVNQSGLITAVGAGNTSVTATSEGRVGTVTVAVSLPPVGSVTVTPPAASLSVAFTTTLSATVRDASGVTIASAPVAWSTDKPLIAAVSQTGVVTGLLPGTATITATSGGQSGAAAITVGLAPVATVTVSPSTLELRDRNGERVGTLTATTRDLLGNILTNRVVTWSSSRTSVATVNQSGVVTAQDDGTATITATSEGKSGTATVNVRN
jgi:trimeric autotransporter adhesin